MRTALVRILLLASVYTATGWVGFYFDAVADFHTLVWPPAAISLVALSLLGRGLWPGVTLGALLVGLRAGMSAEIAVIFAVANTLEAVAGAWALTHVARFHPALDRVRDVVALLAASVGSAALGVAAGAGALLAGDLVAPSAVVEIALVCWLGHGTSNLVLAPVLFTFASHAPSPGKARMGESLALAGALVLVTAVVWFGPGSDLLGPYLFFPLATWAGLRHGPRGAATASLLIGGLALVATALGFGPFVRETRAASLVALEPFAAMLPTSALVVGAMIAELGREESAVRQVERIRAAIVDVAHDAVVTMDHEDRIREFNPAAERIFRMRARDAVGKSVAELLVPPSLRERHRLALRRYLATGATVLLGRRTELPALRGDGSEFPAELVVFRLPTAGPPLFTAFIRDLTVEKAAAAVLEAYHAELEQRVAERTRALTRANDELALRAEQLREAHRLSRLGGFEWDVGADRFRWSDELSELLGVAAGVSSDGYAAFLGLVHADDRARVENTVAHCLATGEPLAMEARLVRADGIERVFRCHARVTADPRGQPTMVIGVFQDITEQWQSARSRAYLAALVEHSSDAIVGTTPDGRIVQWNAGAERLFGWPRCDVIGRSIDVLVPPELRRDERELLARVQRGEPIQNHQAQRLRRDDRRVDVSVSLSPIRDEEGRVTSVASITRDITAAKESERRIERALRDKEVLLKEINHRVKNNLQMVSSLLHLQAGKVSSRDAGLALRESEDRIQSIALVHQLLYRSPDLGVVDFGQYVADLCARLARSCQLRPDDVAMEVSADEVALDLDTVIHCGLVVNELVSNCLRHAFPQGRRGRISVTLRRSADDGLRLTVADDGVGLPAGFDVSTTKTLGLQLVHTLGRQLGGAVQIESAPGRGTSVRISFPRHGPRRECA